ncbi:HNH endonuclease signature motif containing protein [Mesorhizobium sp.]|uniref:HNH endonuclease signature motif containing protein n=1 Tax=Mesorhizobium sp. TaxID=1871066 RepID=UPI0012081BD1|nr:HNH endonuclease signature motif containing protein [Mesorhizobium sp.]TIM06369.1 MAG: HNH endonuclease [Mesorhizobium sp.]
MAPRPHLPALTADRARALLIYNPETGALNWRVARPGTFSGALAGTRTSEGYTQVELDYRLYKAHRVIWLIMTGKWPTHQVDHKNGMRADNRWKNLRAATPLQNARNRRPGKRNRSGRIGVTQTATGRWQAFIGVDLQNRVLGTFPTFEEAAAARNAAEVEHYGEFAAQHLEAAE